MAQVRGKRDCEIDRGGFESKGRVARRKAQRIAGDEEKAEERV